MVAVTSRARLADITLRAPTMRDGARVWELIDAIGVLEQNTPYAYLLLCTHFTDTCVVAERGGELVGFVAAYRPPTRPEVVFVWQVGVSPTARGAGLGRRLLDALVESPGCEGVCALEATVTPSNTASRALFTGFARHRGLSCTVRPCFTAECFPAATADAPHEPEELFHIGPLDQEKT